MSKLAGMKILVIDDDPNFRALCRYALEKLSCRVDGAGNRLEALALIENVKYEVIVLDLVFPGDSGPNILAAIRALLPEQPVLILSGYVSAAIGREINTDKYTLMFEKPMLSGALANVLASNLEKLQTAPAANPP